MANWETTMKVDPVAYSSLGNYSEVSGASDEGAIANLFATLGMVEDAPDLTIRICSLMDYYFRRREL